MVNYKKGKVKKINSDILEGQTSFDDLKDKDMTSAKPIKSILSSIFSKFVS